jgi:hypothetical protein
LGFFTFLPISPKGHIPEHIRSALTGSSLEGQGKFISVALDWNPLKHYSNVFCGYNRPQLDTSDPWQFTNFLITEGD